MTAGNHETHPLECSCASLTTTTTTTAHPPPPPPPSPPLILFPPSYGTMNDPESPHPRDSIDSHDNAPLLALQDHHDDHDSHRTSADTSVFKPTLEHPQARGYWIYLLTLSAGLSGLLFGYDTASIASALLYIPGSLSTPSQPITSFDLSVIASSTSLGALLGGLSAGILADHLGRKRVILFADILFFVGALLQSLAFTLPPLIVGRLIVGIAVGLSSLIVPLYISELAPPATRGRLVVISVLFITFGQLLAYLTGLLLAPPYLSPDLAWRAILGLGAAPALLQTAAMASMPESPRWLLQHNRKAAARETISRIYGTKQGNTIDSIITSILAGIPPRSQLLGFRQNCAAMWHNAADRRALVVACALQFWQQACGFNCLMYFSATVFQALGFSQPVLVALVVAATNAAFTCVAIVLIDRVGRRPMLLASMGGMTLGLLLCAASFTAMPPPPELPLLPTSGVLGGIALFVASYALGLGNVPWVAQSEMFSMRVRGVGTGASTGVNWATNLFVNLVFLELVVRAPGGVFAGFAAVVAVGGALAWWGYPETRGLRMEEVEEVMAMGWRVR